MRGRMRAGKKNREEERKREKGGGDGEERDRRYASDLFDWCTNVLSLGPAHFLALFLFRVRLVDPFVRSPYTFGPFTPH